MLRRDFLTNVASTSLLAALPAIPLSDAERSGLGATANDTWDMTWIDRLRGKSRAVFDSPEVSDGAALFRASLWREQHKAVFGTALADLTPVVVIRHTAIPLVMDDAHWDRFETGKELKVKDPKTDKWARRNPVAGALEETSDSRVVTVSRFLSNNGIVLACGLAFGRLVAKYRSDGKLSAEDAELEAKSHLLPGVILQPSGFFAVLAAQDAGCNYLMGS